MFVDSVNLKRWLHLLLGTSLVILGVGACQLRDLADVDPETGLAQLAITPAVAVLRMNDSLDLTAVALTTSGDTVEVAVTWSSDHGGSIQSKGKAKGRYKAHGKPGDYTVIAEADSGGVTDSALVIIVDGLVASVTVSPPSVTIPIGTSASFDVMVSDSTGTELTDRRVIWTSADSTVARVDQEGRVTGLAVGTTSVTAWSDGASDSASVTITERQSGAEVVAVEVTPTSASMRVGEQMQFTAESKDAAGNVLAGYTVTWASNDSGAVIVNATGMVTAVGRGTTTVIALVDSMAGSAGVTVDDVPPPPNGQFVVYPTENIAFIAGPQVVSGTSPWPFFDANAIATGERHGAAFPSGSLAGHPDLFTINYYDQGLVQYINYYRTGDARFLAYARKINDGWFAGPYIENGTHAYNESSWSPRNVSLDGLMLRAMDGRPEMWNWIYQYVNYHFWLWVERFNTTGQGSGQVGWPDGVYIENGHRDPAYMMLYAAQLAKVLPDSYPLPGGGTATDGAAKRADLRSRVESNMMNYFLEAQWPDGSWRHSSNGDNTYQTTYMLFMGLWAESMIAVHQLSDNPAVHSAIQDALVRFLTHMHTGGPYRGDEPVPGSPLTWRSVWYDYHGGTMDNRTAYENGGASWTGPLPYSDKLREQRQLNLLLLHAFGYAYKLTGASQFQVWGDEWFAASFGNGQGPLADASYSLADFRPKEYDQAYRTAGRYLAWRAGY